MDCVLDRVSYCRIKVRFFSGTDVRMDYWIGAVLRNRFLYAADSIVNIQGISLRQIIDTLPLPENHFLYRQLKGGFPKGFLINCSGLPISASGFTLRANYVYSFSVVLIGKHADYKQMYIDALRKMMLSGFGHPAVPMTIVDIAEEAEGKNDIYVADNGGGTLKLLFRTPVSLMHQVQCNSSNGFQDKLNGFPSLYQFIRSLSYRNTTLYLLYMDDGAFISKEEMDDMIGCYIAPAGQSILLNADLKYVNRHSTPKEGEKSVYSMGGYIGKLLFVNVPFSYRRLLDTGSVTGVGDNINYGFGQFDFDYI